jgi:hypothetical protein
MNLCDAIERSGTLRRSQYFGRHNLGLALQSCYGQRYMLVLINLLEGIDVFGTWIHHNKFHVCHSVLLFSVRLATTRDLHRLNIAPHDAPRICARLWQSRKHLPREILQQSKRYNSINHFGIGLLSRANCVTFFPSANLTEATKHKFVTEKGAL